MISFLKELGCLKYKEKYFINHNEIFNYCESNQINFDINGVSYWFNDDIFSNTTWNIEPEKTLKDLYRERALQLRQKYDYIILSYSGGADSHQMLTTFIENNIFIDEIYTNYPIKFVNHVEDSKDPLNKFGILLEYKYAALPTFNKISSILTKTKITIADSSTYYEERAKNLNFYMDTEPFLSCYSGVFQDIRRAYDKEAFDDIAMKRKFSKVCVLLGAEKPILKYQNKKLYFNFSDFGRPFSPYFQGNSSAHFVPEMFYWSPDLPLIPIKQSHIILKWLCANMPKNITETEKDNFIFKLTKHELMKKIVYPSWDGRYQKTIKGADDEIIKIAINSNHYEFLKERNKYLYRKNKKFINVLDENKLIYNENKNNVFYHSAVSKKYLIGDLE